MLTSSSLKFHMEYESCTNRCGSDRMDLLIMAFMIPATDANTPREKLTMSENLVRRFSCSFQIPGIGSRASKRSVVMLTTV